jgi:purine-binding chemotaxis protein CheW
VIVVQVKRQGDTVTMGAIVDEVSEVLDIGGDLIEPAPEFGTSVDTDFILGMGKIAKKVIMLLDVDKVLSSGDVARLVEAAEHAA